MPRILIHGLEGSSQGHKAQLLRELIPDMVIPDFQGSVPERMLQLEQVMDSNTEEEGWILVGSSLGGLMAAIWTCLNPRRVKKLILLAPALHRAEFQAVRARQNYVRTLLFHGSKDTVVPMEPVLELARGTFLLLQIHAVEDDHRLKATVELLDWKRLLEV